MTTQRQWVDPSEWRRHPRTRRGPCPTCGGEDTAELIAALRARVATLESQGRYHANQQQRMAQLERRP